MAKWWQFNKTDNVKKRADDTDLKNPKAWLLDAWGADTKSGVAVTKETAILEDLGGLVD